MHKIFKLRSERRGFTVFEQLMVIAFLFLLAGMLISAIRSSDKFQPLEHWISVWSERDPEKKAKAEETVRKLGSKAAIEMANWIKSADKRVAVFAHQLAIGHFFKMLNGTAAPSVPILITAIKENQLNSQSDRERYDFTLDILSLLGPTADPSIETILFSLEKHKASPSLSHTVMALSNIGCNSDPAILKRISMFLSSTNFVVRLAAAISLSMISEPNESVTAIIIEALKRNDPAIPPTPLIYLSQFKGDKEVYLPYLVPLVSNPQRERRIFAAKSIGLIGRPAFSVIKDFIADVPSVFLDK